MPLLPCCLFIVFPIIGQTCAECTKTLFFVSIRRTVLLLEDQEAFIGKVNHFILLSFCEFDTERHWKGKQQCALSGLFGDSENVCCVLLPRASSDIALAQNRPGNVCATSTILVKIYKCVSGPRLWEKCCSEERELFWSQ